MPPDILNHPLISERYFFPRAGGMSNPFWIDCGDARLACFYHRPFDHGKTVVFFHGNGEIVPDYLNGFVDVFEKMGWNILLAEYRGYGLSSGHPELGRLLDDVEPILNDVGQPPEDLVLFGRSVGSIFAVHGVSLVPEVAGLILESAVADILERLMLRVRPEELGVDHRDLKAAVDGRLNQREKLEGYPGPVLILHGEQDDLVDVSHAKRLARWVGGAGKARIFPRGGHNDLLFLNAAEYFSLVGTFLKKI